MRLVEFIEGVFGRILVNPEHVLMVKDCGEPSDADGPMCELFFADGNDTVMVYGTFTEVGAKLNGVEYPVDLSKHLPISGRPMGPNVERVRQMAKARIAHRQGGAE